MRTIMIFVNVSNNLEKLSHDHREYHSKAHGCHSEGHVRGSVTQVTTTDACCACNSKNCFFLTVVRLRRSITSSGHLCNEQTKMEHIQ